MLVLAVRSALSTQIVCRDQEQSSSQLAHQLVRHKRIQHSKIHTPAQVSVPKLCDSMSLHFAVSAQAFTEAEG